MDYLIQGQLLGYLILVSHFHLLVGYLAFVVVDFQFYHLEPTVKM